MDYRKTAQEIYDHVGKKANIISAAHCATRLRLVIADNDKADKEYVENIDGVKGVFFADVYKRQGLYSRSFWKLYGPGGSMQDRNASWYS